MSQTTRDNHYVPQAYLRRWARDEAGKEVWGYRTLVSHPEVPVWEPASISKVAFQRDLYTELIGDDEVDRFEQWIEAEFEGPGLEAIANAVRGDPLTKRDWDALALFFALQDRRTPLAYMEATARWHEEMPKVIESVGSSLESGQIGPETTPREVRAGAFEGLFDVAIDRDHLIDDGLVAIRVEVTVGRQFWIKEQEHALIHLGDVLRSHKWGIAKASVGDEWFTSDHPALRLNFTSESEYDMGGGWGRDKGNLIMPISPKHLLFAQIGDAVPDRWQLSGRQTRMIQRFIAERAHRWIFARARRSRVPWLRPRLIDADRFAAEREEWSRWSERQADAEGSG